MDTILIKATQLILAFAILVIIHEFGHFLFARLFGVRVEKFYIFFDPWTEIFKWKPKKYFGFFGKKKNFRNTAPDNESEDNSKNNKSFWGNTEYGIGWLPLGGYCKISGMIDESMDKEQMAKPPQKWEFRSKPAWQRLLIMIAGVLFNFLLAILIYAGIVYASGERYVPFTDARLGMRFSEQAKQIGFKDGDIPLYADSEFLSHPDEARMKMIQAKEVRVLRNESDTVTVKIPLDFIFRLQKEAENGKSDINFMTYRLPAKILNVSKGEGADKAGILPGDRIIAIDSIATPDLHTFHSTLEGHGNKKVNVAIQREFDTRLDTLILPVQLSSNSKMGIQLQLDPAELFNFKEKKYGLFESIPRGIEMGVDKLSSYASSMKLVFTKDGAQSIGGFGAIASIFPEKWNWIAFWNIAAFLSVALAFMNILPIPALDGGHVLFLLYEVITRRKPSEKFMEYAQITGMAILILLLLYANGMDIVRLFK